MAEPVRTVSGFLLAPIPGRGEADSEAACRVCGREGRPVRQPTLGNHVREHLWPLMREEGFRFCDARECPVVYYHPATGHYFGKLDVRTRVGIKETARPIPVCYCLNVLEERIVEEIVAKGCCDSLEDIRQYTGARTGKLCHITNPSGRCCGGHLRAVVEEALARRQVEGTLARKARQISEEVPTE